MDPPFPQSVTTMENETSFNTQSVYSSNETGTEGFRNPTRIFKKTSTVMRVGSRNYKKSQNVGPFRKLLSFFELIFSNTANYFRGVFTIPYIEDRITFCRPDDFNAAGERIKKRESVYDEATLDKIEAACNYSEKTKILFDRILAGRKDNETNRGKQAKDLDFSKLAPWNESLLDRLESTFRVFDTSGDGVVDFEEICSILAEYGDKSSIEDKKVVFDAADVKGKECLNFSEFVTMLHTVSVKSVDTAPPALVETFRQIDRNMARIRNLDVVQQLQTGLF
ncbi:Calmodulin-like protein 1 [Orchesella cincta]|uniref:Calmodulin-like protein 1 n=1 Tax=Orchesella cincta TaxID=48709 RepID=A0A1D2NCK6_ORCCI|nr:Calmodulin-like protein 1 [Orchesella cincta]